MKPFEILAPAGSPAHLPAAVRLGAGAVYLGLKDLSARAHAGNFTPEELYEAVRCCHERDVKVYVTLNTLLKDRELNKADEAAALVCETGADAVIVQDLGLAARIKRCAPDLPLHASTQMSVHTPAGARLLYERGFSRVVLARECSEKEIEEIARACPIELEVFVHGALCMSVSGQCYLSAMLGGRSGNRGQCAQPCRLPFHVPGSDAFALSLRDLSLIGRLRELRGMGVVSAKIEGRMKRPEYVAAAVRACRQALDGGSDDEVLRDLQSVFSRSGFTSGYYDEKIDKTMFGIRQKEDVTAATDEVLARLRGLYKDESARIPVRFFLTLRENEETELRAEEGAHTVTVAGQPAEAARSRPLTADDCRAQLCKTGGTPYFCAPEDVTLSLPEGLSLPLSALNRMRRSALEALSEKRARRAPILWRAPKELHGAPVPCHKDKSADNARLRAHFMDARLPSAAQDCELCWLPLFTPPETLAERLREGFHVGVELPRGLFSQEEHVRSALRGAYEAGVRDAYVGNLGGIEPVREAGLTLHGGFGLNVMNGRSLEALAGLGVADCELSIELSAGEIRDIPKKIPAGAVIYGRLPLMLTRCCPLKSGGRDCNCCPGRGALTDRKGMRFPVSCTAGCAQVYNAVPLDMGGILQEITGVDFVSLRFTVENYVEIEEKLAACQTAETPRTGFTRGRYRRGVE